jgi:hypothetical protein
LIGFVGKQIVDPGTKLVFITTSRHDFVIFCTPYKVYVRAHFGTKENFNGTTKDVSTESSSLKDVKFKRVI